MRNNNIVEVGSFRFTLAVQFQFFIKVGAEKNVLQCQEPGLPLFVRDGITLRRVL